MSRRNLEIALTPAIGIVLAMVGVGYGQTKQAAEAGEIATRLVKMHQAWGPAISSPDASATLVELSRKMPAVTYHLYAKGLPRDKTYDLLSWPVTEKVPVKNLDGVTLDESGLAICAGKAGTCGSPDTPNDPIDLTALPTKGEPFRVGLVSADGKIKAFAKIVPIPNVGKDEGCEIEAVVLTPGSEVVAIEGRGLPPGGELEFESHSGKERQDRKAKADAGGRYVSAIMPYVEGAKHGTTNVKIRAAKCSPELSFDWGKR